MKKFNQLREESLEEKLKASDPAGKYIHDFVHSDNPKFAGKSKAKRIQMALAASYAAKGKSRNEEVEQVDEIDMSKTLDAFNKNRPAHSQAKVDTRSVAQRKAETDTKLAAQKKPFSPTKMSPASKDDMHKQIAKSYASHKPGQYVGDSVELDGEIINELSKKQVEEGVMKAVKNLVKKASKTLTGGTDEDQRKDLQRKMGVPQTGKKPMQK